jgi:hypothetical protein
MDQTIPLPTPPVPRRDDDASVVPVTSNDEFTRQLLAEIEQEASLVSQNMQEEIPDTIAQALTEANKAEAAQPLPKTPTFVKPAQKNIRENRAKVKQEQTQTKGSEKIINFLQKIFADANDELERSIDDALPYLPQEIVGGAVPYIKGMEESTVWNAAVQACGSERIYYSYTVYDERCWYIACPASAMASHPDSWCPLISALPGNSEFLDKETVYIYEEAGIAAALRWDEETGRLQVFSGPSRSVLPKIQSMDANFVTIDSELATRYPWQCKSLLQEHLSRTAISWLVKSAALVSVISFFYIIYVYAVILLYNNQLIQEQRDTAREAQNLLNEATNALQSTSHKHLFRLQELLDEIGNIGGVLTQYQVDNKGKVMWSAIVPAATPNENLSRLSARSTGQENDGRIRIEGQR